MKNIYEKLGLFYLGKDSDENTPTLYKSKHLTTHAAIIGMTGSGKTGLGISIIEEAAIDNIPAIIIDPKGDMGNLCLGFPKMRAEDFEPWVDGNNAQETAKVYKNGLESFGQDLNRVKTFAEVEKTIYTPGSSAGVGVNILGSFEAPSQDILDDSDTFSSLINTTVSSLLALISIKNDSLNSEEHLLLSNIFYHFWSQEVSLSIEELIGHVVSPPFQKVGILSLDSFYPQKERMKLAQLLNGIISSISFSSWLKGEPLNIQDMLYDKNAKAKIAIFSIAHLNDDQRMFFVTILLNAYISWMRRQRGSSTLKALLYMDEIFGFFPPTKNPPSKEPMLLLLKQARAFGTGVILSTQNPADIDYKGLSNIGTWFIGKLQTKQDIAKVLDGISAKSNLSKSEISKKISTLKGRHFFLKNVHEESTKEFYTRWVLSYLKGPMTKDDIRVLMRDKKGGSTPLHVESKKNRNIKTNRTKPIVSSSIKEYFLDSDINSNAEFYPYLYGKLKLRFYSQRRGIDKQEKLYFKLDIDDSVDEIEFETSQVEELSKKISTQKRGASYAKLSPLLKDEKSIRKFEKKLLDFVYHSKRLELFTCKKLKLESTTTQSRRDFIVDVKDVLKQNRELAIAKLQKRFKTKYNRFEDKFERLYQKLEKEEADVSSKVTDTLLSIGATLFGAFFSQKKLSVTNINRASSSFKKGKRIFKERDDVKNTQALIDALHVDANELEEELEIDIQKIQNDINIENYDIETISIKPRRSDISIEDFALLWER